MNLFYFYFQELKIPNFELYEVQKYRKRFIDKSIKIFKFYLIKGKGRSKDREINFRNGFKGISIILFKVVKFEFIFFFFKF